MALLRCFPTKSRGKKGALLGQFRRSPSSWSFPRDQSSVHVWQKLHGPESTLRHHRSCGEVGAPAHRAYRYVRPSISGWAYVRAHTAFSVSLAVCFSLPRAPEIKFAGKWWQWRLMSIYTKHTSLPRQRARDCEDNTFLRHDYHNLISIPDVFIYIYISHYKLMCCC